MSIGTAREVDLVASAMMYGVSGRRTRVNEVVTQKVRIEEVRVEEVGVEEVGVNG